MSTFESFATVITRMTAAAAKGDGQAVADCFTEDGIYHDCFYGSFQGRLIADMIENYFHRDAKKFLWEVMDPVEQNGMGYVRYMFSYESRLEEAEGRRALFEGVCVCRMRDGKIEEYREVANAGTGLQLIGFPPKRLAKFMQREVDELLERKECEKHMALKTPNVAVSDS